MNKLGRGPQDVTYRISNLYAIQFQRKKIEDGLLCSYVSACDRRGGASFDLRGKFGRGSQGDAIYQISKLLAFQFQRRRILKFSFYVSNL